MSDRHPISFADDSHPSVAVPPGRTLPLDLTVKNSPVLFGCRTGICGTCVVEVLEGADTLPEPDEDEREILDLYAEGNARARLACQLDVQGPITLRALCENRWQGV